MSAKDCINRKAQAGKVDPGKTARLVGLLDDLEAEARGSMGPNAAADQAAVEAEIALARQTQRRAVLAVHRDPLSGTHQQDVARSDTFDSHVLRLSAHHHSCGLGLKA